MLRCLLSTLAGSVICVGLLEGCQVYDTVKPDSPDLMTHDVRISGIELKDGTVLRFERDTVGFASNRDTVILRRRLDGSCVTYPLSQVRQIHIVRPSSVGDDLALAGFITLAIIVAIVLAIRGMNWHMG